MQVRHLIFLFASMFFWRCTSSPPPVVKVVDIKPQKNTSTLMDNLWELPSLGMREELKSPASLENPEWMALFQSERNPVQAYSKLKKVLQSDKRGDVGLLFKSFSRAPAFLPPNRKGRDYLNFTKEWVLDALASRDESVRAHYSEYYHQIKPKGIQWNRFQSKTSQMIPGDMLSIRSFQFRPSNRRKQDLYFIRVERLASEGASHLVAQDTLFYSSKGYSFEEKLNQSGLHRVSIYNSLYFQQLYILVTRLNVAVKSDSSHLVIWGTSHNNEVAPPYDVTVFFNRDKKVKVTTDEFGLVGIKKDPSDTLGHHRYQILMEKENDLAYASGLWDVSIPPALPEYLHLYSNKGVYAPGEVFHFQGIARPSEIDISPGPLPSDSLRVELVEPNKKTLLSMLVPIEKEGGFGDSIQLDESFYPGVYQVKTYWHFSTQKTSSSQSGQPAGILHFSVVRREGDSEFKIVSPDTVVPSGEKVFMSLSGNGKFSGEPLVVRLFSDPWGMSKSMATNRNPERQELGRDTLVLPPSGNMEIEFTPPKKDPAQYIVVSVEPLDASHPSIESQKILVTSRLFQCDLYVDKLEHPIKGEVSGFVRCRNLFHKEADPLSESVTIIISTPSKEQYGLQVELDKQGGGAWKYKVENSGAYTFQIAAGSSDSNGLYETKPQAVYVYQRSGENWAEDSLKVQTDKPFYEVGDTAVLGFFCNRLSAKLMVSLENRGLKKVQIVPIQGGHGTIKIPIRKDQERLLHLALQGKGRLYQKVFCLPMKLNRAGPQVVFSGKTELNPGERFKGQIAITDAMGRPVKGRFSLSLMSQEVSRSVEESKTPKNFSQNSNSIQPYILSTFDNEAVPLLSTQLPYFTQALADEEHPSRSMTFNIQSTFGDRADEEDWETTLNLSEAEFRTHWESDLRTDDSGRKVLDLVLPGSHNQWLLEVTGRTEQGVFKKRQAISVELPFVAKIFGAAQAQKGEDIGVGIRVKRIFDSPFPISLGLTLVNRVDSTVSLWDSSLVFEADQESQEVVVRVPLLAAGNLELKATIEGANHKEMLKHFILSEGVGGLQSMDHSAVIWGAEAGKQNYYRLDFNFKEGESLFPAKIYLDYYSSIHSLSQDVVEKWPSTPHLSVFDRAAHFLILNSSIRDSVSSEKMEDVLQMAYESAGTLMRVLVETQNSDGGWGWKEGLPSDLEWTCLATLAFYDAFKLSGTQSELYNNHLKKARAWIQGHLNPRMDENSLAYALNTLCRAGSCKTNASKVPWLEKNIHRMSSYGLVLYLDVLCQLNQNAQKQAVLEIIKKQLIKMPSENSLSGDIRSPWYSQSVETTAQALRVFSKWSLEEQSLSKLVTYLMRNRSEGGWGHPKTTATVMDGLLQWAEKYEPQNEVVGKIFFNGEKIHQFHTSPDSLSKGRGHLEIPLDQQSKENRIVMGFDGIGHLYYSGSTKFFIDKKENSEPHKGRELSVAQSVRKLTVKKVNGQWLSEFVAIDSSEIIAGDELEVVLDLKSFSSHKFLNLKAGIPSGTHFLTSEPIRGKKERSQERSKNGKSMELVVQSGVVKNGEVVFSLPQLDRGEYQFSYRIKTKFPGRVVLPVAVIESELNPKLFGQSESINLYIE